MTTPHDWADVLERAKTYAKYVSRERIVDLAQDQITRWGTLRDAENLRAAAIADAAALRTLAAAMRGAQPDDIADVKITGRYRLTLPEAP